MPEIVISEMAMVCQTNGRKVNNVHLLKNDYSGLLSVGGCEEVGGAGGQWGQLRYLRGPIVPDWDDLCWEDLHKHGLCAWETFLGPHKSLLTGWPGVDGHSCTYSIYSLNLVGHAYRLHRLPHSATQPTEEAPDWNCCRKRRTTRWPGGPVFLYS